MHVWNVCVISLPESKTCLKEASLRTIHCYLFWSKVNRTVLPIAVKTEMRSFFLFFFWLILFNSKSLHPVWRTEKSKAIHSSLWEIYASTVKHITAFMLCQIWQSTFRTYFLKPFPPSETQRYIHDGTLQLWLLISLTHQGQPDETCPHNIATPWLELLLTWMRQILIYIGDLWRMFSTAMNIHQFKRAVSDSSCVWSIRSD